MRGRTSDFTHLQLFQAWQAATRHTESKRLLVVLFTNGRKTRRSHCRAGGARRPVGCWGPNPNDADGSAAVQTCDVRRYKPMQNLDYLTYEEFGRRFFEVAVTPERVASALADIAGNEFAMEPIAQGPGGIAKVSANVKIMDPRVTRKLGDSITFVIHIPLSIDLLLDLRLDKQRFKVSGDIALRATARAAEPLLLIVDVAKPRPSDIPVYVVAT